jgi:hypothetical protein
MRSLAKASAVTGGAIFSVRLVKNALAKRLYKSRRAQLYRAYADAARDPEYMAAMDEISRAFDVTISDGLTEVYK